MDRRVFLASLAAGLTLDPERLLWKRGARVYSIPKPRRRVTVTYRNAPILSPSEVARAIEELSVGDVFHIHGFFECNPVDGRRVLCPSRPSLHREADLQFARRFVAGLGQAQDGSMRPTVFPPIITAGHYRNVDVDAGVMARLRLPNQ